MAKTRRPRLKTGKTGRPRDDISAEAIKVAMELSSNNRRKAATRLAITTPTLRKAMRWHGLTFPKMNVKKLSEDQEKDIRELRSMGASLRDLATQFEVSFATIYNLCRP